MRQAIVMSAVALAMSAAPMAKGTQANRSQAKSNIGSDNAFVMKAARGGMEEVELGKLATEKASSPEVKQFGQKMVDDHSKANDELKSLAQSKNVTLPTDLTPAEKAKRDRLSKLSGEAFDRAYMREMVTDHRMDVNEFRRESRSGHDSDVKAWAAKTLPTLEDHLKTAQSTNKTVATSGTQKGRTKGTSGSASNTQPPASKKY